MKLNQLNLTVTDVSAAKEFLERYFGLRTVHRRGDSFAVLFDFCRVGSDASWKGPGSAIRRPLTLVLGKKTRQRWMRFISD